MVAGAAENALTAKGAAVLAVGGYGRRQLFPYSDVDLLLLFENERALAEARDAIGPVLQSLWDAGLRISHSVRTVAECLEVHEQNAELNVSLLDQRFLCGNRGLHAQLADRLPRFLRGNREALTRNLTRLARQRHERYAKTIYHLEPNVKETPGGLRDHQLVCWLAQLRQLDPEAQLGPAFLHLAQIRLFLHSQAGRDANVLTFDAQDALADLSGAGDAAVEMREYYRHARLVFRAALKSLESAEAQNSSLFSQFRDRLSRLDNAEFSVHRERVHFRAPLEIESNPELALRFFEFTARHGVQPSAEAERQIETRLPALRRAFADSLPLWPELNRILSLPHAPEALGAMHELGVLTALFPELNTIDCLVVRDFYHRYTVDEHSLVAMRKAAAAEGSFQSLRAEIESPGVLMFALLFHDSGKGETGRGHVDASIDLAERAMLRIQMPSRDRDFARFLIARHLDLSAAMQARDLADPQTARDLASRIETVERLKALALLTYADISAVNPEAMTSWRADQLWQLYLAVYNELTRGLESERIEASGALAAEQAQFLEGFPKRYLRTHTPEEIGRHIELDSVRRQRGVAIDIRKLDSAWQLTMLAGDRPGLFAAAAGTLAGFGMNILRAEAFSNRRGLVLDTFRFSDPNRNLDLNPSEVDRLRLTAERVISGRKNVVDLLKNRPKPVRPSRKAAIAASVAFQSGAGAATLIEIVAEDRPGLLYDLASAISAFGANIEVVMVATEAHKAIDVFYVTKDGRKLDAPEQERLGAALRTAIG